MRGILILLILLLIAFPAYCQSTFTELLGEAVNQYEKENYLSVKNLMMRATANLNNKIAGQLEKGEISFPLFRDELSQLMDVQFKEWRTDFLGKRVLWQGWVSNVKKEWYGSYTVYLEMDKPETEPTESNVSLVLTSSQKEVAEGFLRGMVVKFKGSIYDITRKTGKIVVIIKNVEII